MLSNPNQKVVMHVLQQSIFTEVDGVKKWLTADSGIQMAIGITRELVEKFPETRFIIVYSGPFVDVKSPRELFNHTNVHWENLRQPVDAALVRYNFSYTEWQYLLRRFQPDILWNDIPELTRNFRAVLDSLDMTGTHIIQCNYWGQFPMVDDWARVDPYIGYEYRQLDGALTADLTPYSCESVKNGFLLNAQSYIPRLSDLKNLEAKSPIWNFGFSAKELDRYKDKASVFQKPVIVFPNRLARNNYTNWQQFISAVNAVWEKRQDFGVIFTNPSQKVSWEQLKKDVKPLLIYKEGPLNREEYATLLWGSQLACSLYTNERNGGCANVETAYCGALPIMPRMFEYARRAPSSYPGFLPPRFNVQYLADTIEFMLDHYAEMQQRYEEGIRNRVMESSFEEAQKHVVPHLTRMLQNKREVK